ncbi:MAG TPA: hypothetical protein VEK79_25125 [Thermoanaerobaculia bacterium]|nr:hypothetical protein [Thermoanaerobaculia bacterium]
MPRLLMVLAIPVLIAGCAARPMPDPGPMPFRGGPCAGGKAASTKQAPIVCIDDSARTLSVSPDPIAAHDAKASNRATPVTMQWFTTSGSGDVRLEIEPGCVANVRCNGNGHCTAQTVSVSGARKECKYDVWIEGGNHDRLDPTIVVDPCCG